MTTNAVTKNNERLVVCQLRSAPHDLRLISTSMNDYQSDNDAAIVRSLLFLMDSNVETKHNDAKEDGVVLNQSNIPENDLSQGSIPHKYTRSGVGLNATDIGRESANFSRKFNAPENSSQIGRKDDCGTHDSQNSADASNQAHASLCSASIAVCRLQKEKLSTPLHADKRGNYYVWSYIFQFIEIFLDEIFKLLLYSDQHIHIVLHSNLHP